jgi:hypothetical protein
MKILYKFFLPVLLLVLANASFAQDVEVCISINGSPLPSDKTARLCRYGTLTISATNCASSPASSVTYKWRNLDVPPSLDSTNSTIQIRQTGRWMAIITNTTTMTEYRDTITVSNYPLVDVNVAEDHIQPTCPLDTVALVGQPVGNVVSYQWYEYDADGETHIIPGATKNNIKFIKKNIYYILEVKDNFGCSGYDTTMMIPQTEAFIVNLGPDPIPMCEGGTITLLNQASRVFDPITPPAYTYVYGDNRGNPPHGGTSSNDVPPSHTVTPPIGVTKYWLRISKSWFCTNTDTITVVVHPKPAFSLGSDKTICYNSSTTIAPTISQGTPPYSYTWSSVPAGTSSTASSITVTPSAATTYNLQMTDANNCGASTVSVNVAINPEVHASLISNDTSICKLPAGTAQLAGNGSGGTGIFTYSWSPVASLSNPSSATTDASPGSTTEYTFTVRDSENCSASKKVTVTVYRPPLAVLPQQRPVVINETSDIDLEVAGNGSLTYSWYEESDPANILSTTPKLPIQYIEPDTMRYVIMIEEAPSGCLNYDTIEVHAISNNISFYVPNAFSPNAIDSENQKIKIYGNNILPDGFKFLIFNKWGNVVYETTDLSAIIQDGWNGEGAVAGVYTYILIGKFKNGRDLNENPQYKGTINLIR